MSGSSWRCIALAGFGAVHAVAAEPAVIETVRSGNMVQLQELIARNGGLNARGAQGQTALHEAAARCSLEAARVLVQAGLDPSVRNDAGRTAAMVSLNCTDAAVKNELLRILYVEPTWVPNAPVSPTARPRKPHPGMERWTLHGAAARGEASVVDMMLRLGADVNGVDEKGERALEAACRKGDARTVELLLARGADVKLPTAAGTSVLHEAALGGNGAVIDLLIARGAVVDVPDQEKSATPLHYAASFGRLDAARALVRHGADVRRKDRSGRDALTLAQENGQTEVAEMLRGSNATAR